MKPLALPPMLTGMSERARLWVLAVCGLAVGACVVSFNLLFLFAPDGWAPHFGFSLEVAAAYSRFTPHPPPVFTTDSFRRACLTLVAAMWIVYLAAVLFAATLRDGAGERKAMRLVIVAAAVISVALIATPPVLSADLYHYALFGRMVITRGLNPYVTPGNVMVGDPLWELANWKQYPTHYGPVFTGLSVVAAWIGAGSAIGTALAFKTMTTAFGGVAAWSVAGLARQDGRSPVLPLVLIAWSPLALLETAGSGHNEMVMMGLALAGVYLMRGGRPGGRPRPNLGFVLLVCSVHVKWVSAALLGLAVIAQLRDVVGARARAKELARLAAIAIGVTVVLYLPFWAGRGSMTAVRMLIMDSTNAAGQKSTRLANLVPFAVVALIAIGVVARHGRRFVLEMASAVSLAFVIFVFNWMFPWYVLPALALAAAGPLTLTNGGLLIAVTACSMLLMKQWAVLVRYAQ